MNTYDFFNVISKGIFASCNMKNFNLDPLKTYLLNIVSGLPGNVFWKNRESIYVGGNNYVIISSGANDEHEFMGSSDYDFS